MHTFCSRVFLKLSFADREEAERVSSKVSQDTLHFGVSPDDVILLRSRSSVDGKRFTNVAERMRMQVEESEDGVDET